MLFYRLILRFRGGKKAFMLFVCLFSLLLIGTCFLLALVGRNWNLKPLLSVSAGVLLAVCFLEFLPQAFQKDSSLNPEGLGGLSPDFFGPDFFSHHGISLLILSGILLQALADIYLLPYLSFFDRFLETKTQQRIPHSHTFSPISVCSVTGCLSICSFFDGIRLLSAFGMEGSVALSTAFALFVHLLSEGVLIAVLALSSRFKLGAILVLVGILGVTLILGATFAEFVSQWLSFQALVAFSSGCLLYVCFVHLLPSALKSKERLWFFAGLILFLLLHFLH